MQKGPIKLEKYEEKDPLWWCRYHKETVKCLKLRFKQLQTAETDEEKKTYMSLITVILDAYEEE